MGSVVLNADEIKKIIPHREPILLIDEVEIDTDNCQAKAVFNLETRLHLFAGHFPDSPVLPGIYMVEAMAQAAAVMFLHLNPSFIDQTFFLGSIDNIRFRRTVLPDDKAILLNVKIVHQKISSQSAAVKLSGIAQVGRDELASEALFTGIGIILPV